VKSKTKWITRIISLLLCLSAGIGWFVSKNLAPKAGITEGQRLPEGATQPQVVLLNDDALLLAPDGALYRWGGKSTTSKTPMRIKPDLRFRKIAVNQNTSLAIHEDGTIWGWGKNHTLVADDPNFAPQEARRLFPDVGFVDISMGNWHALALKDDGSIWSWGNNHDGQLGTGRINESDHSSRWTSLPLTQIGLETDWAEVQASSTVSYGLKLDGTLMRWGKLSVFKGLSSSKNSWTNIESLIEQATEYSEPHRFTDIKGWKQIIPLQYVTLLLHEDGSLWIDRPPPRPKYWIPYSQVESNGLGVVENSINFNQIVASEYCILAQKKNGSWWGIGQNMLNQMGLNEQNISKSSQLTPHKEWIALPEAFDPWAIDSASQATIVMTRDGRLWNTGRIIGEQRGTPYWNKIASWINSKSPFTSLPSHLPNHYSGFHHIWTWQSEKPSNANSH
jgi:alpha-tubulin suppressor-like RCC1 family protein